MPAKLSQERRARIVELYQQGKPACDIAKWLRHDRGTVLQILHDEGVPIRRGAKNRDLTEEQEAEAKLLYENGLEVIDLMKHFGVKRTSMYNALRRQGTKMRSQKNGPEAANWKGGRRQNSEGYVEVWVGANHPMATSGAYAREHRLVMAQHLGRHLRSDEQVHHLNGDRADNRIENLQLRNGAHGSGQRLCCADCGSTNLQALEL